MIVEDETYISLINDIYDAALDHKCWLGAMEKIADFVGGSATNIFLHDKADGQSVYFQWGNDPYYDRLYFEKYAPLNPMFPGAMLFDVGQVQAQNDVVPYHEFYETRFFKEWMEPQGIVDSIGGIVEKSAGSVAMLVVRMHQRDGLVNDDMRRRFSLVLPHVRRSLLIGQVISFKEAKAAVMAETLSRLTTAMFLVDGRGGIVLANDAGSELLAEGVVAHGAAGQLNIVSREVNRILIAACAASAEQDSSGLGCQGVAASFFVAEERWLMHVLPLTSGARREAGIVYSAVAAIFVRRAAIDTPSALELVSRMYGLTPSEARVVQAVIDVGGVGRIADALGILPSTVKTHLHRVFMKTGTTRQSELVRLVAAHVSPYA
jgi:DNA-binding CsgD family transcriptional regulator